MIYILETFLHQKGINLSIKNSFDQQSNDVGQVWKTHQVNVHFKLQNLISTAVYCCFIYLCEVKCMFFYLCKKLSMKYAGIISRINPVRAGVLKVSVQDSIGSSKKYQTWPLKVHFNNQSK